MAEFNTHMWIRKLKESRFDRLNEGTSEFDKNYDQYHKAMSSMHKIVSKQDKGVARKLAKAWQSIEDVLENYIG